MDRPIRWGILGAGKIARKFAADLARVPGADLLAVGSQSEARARAFALECGVPRHYGSYEELLREAPVDVVYVATRNPAHQSASRLALEAGKPVLCEKPFAINAGEALATIELARGRRLFCMEAMWTRCFPAMLAARKWLAEGMIGELRMLQADFGFRAIGDSVERLFNPALGGGSFQDLN